SGGTNANGGRGGNFTLTLGAGGAKSGSGVAGVAGKFILQNGAVSQSLNFDPNAGTITGTAGAGTLTLATNVSIQQGGGGSLTLGTGGGGTAFAGKMTSY